MSGWAMFWGVLFGAVLVLYSGLVVWVGIGGFKDIKEMFKKLDEQHKDDEADQP